MNWINIPNIKRPSTNPSYERSSGYAALFVGGFVAVAFALALAPSPVQAQPAIWANVQRPLADVLEEMTPTVVNIAVTSASPSGTISARRKHS